MPKSVGQLVARICVALLATLIAQSNAAIVLCVTHDHTVVEAVHGEQECVRHAHGVRAPDVSCKDTLLSHTATAAAPERTIFTALPVTDSVARFVPALAVARLGSGAPPPPRDLDRARSSTVLLI